MADYVTKIRTRDGDKKIDYNELANLPDIPSVDESLLNQGDAADAKVTGDKIAELKNETSELKGDLDRLNEGGLNLKDGVITEDKFTSELKLKVLNDYVTPEMFGAIGDGEADDTSAIQNASDYAVSRGVVLKFNTSSIYRVTGSITLSGGNQWVGSFVGSKTLDEKHAEILFHSTNGTLFVAGSNAQRNTFSGIYFHSSSLSNTLFSGGLDGGLFENNIVHQFGYVFNWVNHVSIIRGNIFSSVGNNFFTSGLTDSEIYSNYISGYRLTNPVCFTSSVVHSKIHHNFFDYWKFVVSGNYTKNTVFDSNIFDYCYRVFNADNINMSDIVISNNIFANIANCITSDVGFLNADEMMKQLAPRDIFSGKITSSISDDGKTIYSESFTYKGITKVSITGNSFDGGLCFISPRNGVVCVGNTNGHGIIILGDDTTNNYAKCIIDWLDYEVITEIPNTNSVLWGDGLYEGCHKIYQGVILTAQSGQMVDSFGYVAIKDGVSKWISDIQKGCIPLKYINNAYISYPQGTVKRRVGSEMTEFTDCSGITKLKILVGNVSVSIPNYRGITFWNSEKNAVVGTSTPLSTKNTTYNITVPEGASYFTIDYYNAQGILGYIDVYDDSNN